jgi:hypothetical protein
VNLYEYAPPLISIFLIIISDLAAGRLRQMVKSLIGDKRSINEVRFIQNIALDWATRLNFFSLVLASIFSVYAIFGNTQSYGWTFIAVAVLSMIFVPTYYWINSYSIGDLVAISRTRFFDRFTLDTTPARVCEGISIVINLIVIAAILISQIVAPTS